MNNPELFLRSPWFHGEVDLPHHPAGMLGTQEALLCYYLTKGAFAGRGTIVDAGSFLGKSAYFFAQGLRANPVYVPQTHRIHCFDNFLVNEGMTVEFIRNYLGKRVAVGDSTRKLFDSQVAPVLDMLEVHAGDFHAIEWTHQPIEILMVDIAKSESLGRRVVELFFPDLIPGESLVVHQDYHHPWLPHIHVVMEYLADYFELVSRRVDDSAVFRYHTQIPAEVLDRAIRYDFTSQEKMQLMDGAVRRLPPEDRYYVELARLVLKSGLGQGPGVEEELAELHSRFKQSARGYSRNAYFEDVAGHLNEIEAWRLYRAGDFVACLRLADEIVARRRNSYSVLLRGYALSGLERFEEAEREFRLALEIGPSSGYSYVELARALMHCNRLAEAEAEVLRGLDDSTATDAPTKHFLEVLYLIWYKKNLPSQDRATMAELFRRLPDDPETWMLDGRLHQMSGDLEGAERSWRKATELGLSPERLSEVTVTSQQRQDAPSPMDLDARTSGGTQPEIVDPNRPWRGLVLPDSVTTVKSLLAHEEKQYLTWLITEKYEGWGAIVELGAWLGSSSVCLAEGLRRRSLATKIQSFDHFEWDTVYSHIAEIDLDQGSDFLPLYLQGIGDYAPWIDVKKQDLMGYVWEGGPIEILFIDSAKTWELTNSILRGFGSNLVPGRSRVVLQDFRFAWAHCLPLIFDSRPDIWKQIEDVESSFMVTFSPLKALFGPCGIHETYVEESFPFIAAKELLERRLNKEQGKSRTWIGWTLYRKCLIDGPFEEAKKLREKIVAEGIDPEDLKIVEQVEYILHPRGWGAFTQGDFETAKSCAERSLMHPTDRSPYSLNLLGFSLLRLGKREQARCVAEEILSRLPNFASAKILLAELAIAEGRYQAAELECLEVLRAKPTDEITIEWSLNTLLQCWNLQPLRQSRAGVLAEFVESLGASPAFGAHLAREKQIADHQRAS